MKTQLLGTLTSHEVIPSHPLLNKIIKDCTPKIIAAKQLGIKHSAIQLPPSDFEAKLQDYIEPIRTDFDSYIPEIKAQLIGDTQQIQGNIAKNAAQKRDQELTQNKAEIDSEIELFKSNKQEKLSYIPAYIMFTGIVLILLIYSGEVSFLSTSLQIITTSYLRAIILGTAISTSMLLISHLAPVYTDQIGNKITRILARVTVCIIVISAFWFLGQLRASYVALTTKDDTEAFSFVLINSLLFIAMFLIAYFLIFPNISPVKQIREINTVLNKIRSLEAKSKSIGIEIETNREELAKELSKILDRMHLAKASERLINNLYYKAVAEYVLQNTLKRGVRVPCHSDSPASLDFTSLIELKKNED